MHGIFRNATNPASEILVTIKSCIMKFSFLLRFGLFAMMNRSQIIILRCIFTIKTIINLEFICVVVIAIFSLRYALPLI